jgi:hypothetical protein
MILPHHLQKMLINHHHREGVEFAVAEKGIREGIAFIFIHIGVLNEAIDS